MVEIDPYLCEEAVFGAVMGSESHGRAALAQEYCRAREEAYLEAGDPSRRDEVFGRLHRGFFSRLGFDRLLREALQDFPQLEARLARAVFLPATRPAEEGAELFVRPEGESTAIVRLRPGRFHGVADLVGFLRRELMVVDDMLAPEFGYRPETLLDGLDEARAGLVRDRYRVLWEASVDRRLEARGWGGPEPGRGEAALGRVFRELAPAELVVLTGWLRATPRPAHADLVRLARTPREALAELTARTSG